MAYCDFCKCVMCQTGHGRCFDMDGNETSAVITLDHTQTVDGRWICSTCYHYEVCLDNGSKDPCWGACGDNTCGHRPELVNDEWTFWTFHVGTVDKSSTSS